MNINGNSLNTNNLSLQQEIQGIPDSVAKTGHKYRLFITGNQEKAVETLNDVSKTQRQGQVILGVSGFFLLNIASLDRSLNQQLEPPYVILLDVSEQANVFWKEMIPIIKRSSSASETYQNMEQYLKDNADNFNGIQYVDYTINLMIQEIMNGQTWLSTYEQFNTIKAIVEKDRLIFKLLDLNDPTKLEALDRVLSHHALSLDIIYLSNTREYAEDDKVLKTYKESMQKLQNSFTYETQVIDTEPRQTGINSHNLLQTRIRSHLNSLEEICDHSINTRQITEKSTRIILPGWNSKR